MITYRIAPTDAIFGRARQFQMTEPRCGGEFDLAGGSGSLGVHDFMDWYTRAREVGLRLDSLPEVVFERRQHFTNTGRVGREERRRTYLASIKAKLARERAAAVPDPARQNPT